MNVDITPIELDGQVIKFTSLKQFPEDEILNKEDRLVRGWTSVEVKDSQGEIVPIAGLRKTMNTWMGRGGVITDQHTNRVIGKALRWYEDTHEKSGKQGIVIDYKIFKDYTIDDQAWEEIKAKKRKGLSFGGRALGKPTEKLDDYSGQKASELKDLETYEMASVFDPANDLAENTMVNFLAKSKSNDNQYIKGLVRKEAENLTVDLQKGYEVVDINKPFAGFENFDACVESQTKRGHNEESSKRICGWLKNRLEGKKKEDTGKADGQTFKKGDEVMYGPLDGNKYMKAVIVDDLDSGSVKIKIMDTDKIIDTDKDNVSYPSDLSFKPKEIDDAHSTKPLKGETDNKSTGEIAMTTKTKQDEPEDKKPQEGQPSEEKQEDTPVTLTDIASKLDQLIEVLSKGKQDAEEEEEDPKKPEDEAKGEDAPADAGSAPADGGDAPADGDTPDGDAPAEGDDKSEDAPDKDDKPKDDAEDDSEKSIDAIVEKKLQDKLKSLGLTKTTKTTTPRVTQQDVKKTAAVKDPTLEMLDKAKSGPVDMGKINNDIKKMRQDAHEQGLRAVLDQ